MTGPVNIPARRQVHDLDRMLAQAGGVGWDGLAQKMLPALVGDRFRPEDAVLEALGRMWLRPADRAVIEWFFDLTARAPYPNFHGDMEATALAAAKHMARSAVGETVCHGLSEGLRIIEQQQRGQ